MMELINLNDMYFEYAEFLGSFLFDCTCSSREKFKFWCIYVIFHAESQELAYFFLKFILKILPRFKICVYMRLTTDQIKKSHNAKYS